MSPPPRKSRAAPVRDTKQTESDRIEDQAHPREVYDLIGQDAALNHAAQAIRAGKPPQAWLIAGPPGIGKATLAYRMARYLVRFGATAEGPTDLAVAPNDIVSRQIQSESHPGLVVLKRREDDKGRMRSVLTIDEIGKLESFFGLTSGAGGWRVAIIDTADDMNDNAANALLKILEEPPRRAILLVLSHAPGRLLPTIRSRCRRLDLRPLPQDILSQALARLLPDADSDARAALAEVAEGSLGLALRLAGGGGMALAQDAEAVLAARGAPDIPTLFAMGERVSRVPDGIEHFGQFLVTALRHRISKAAETGEVIALDRHVSVWERLQANFLRADALHLEPRQTVMSAALAISGLQQRK